MFACFTFQLSSTLLLNNILLTLTRGFIGKQLLWRKFARNPLKTPVKEQQQKFTMHNLLYEIFRYQKLPHAFQTSRTIVEIATNIQKPTKYQSTPTQGTKLIKLYSSDLFDIFIVPQFIVNQPSDKRILHISNIQFILHTQAN